MRLSFKKLSSQALDHASAESPTAASTWRSLSTEHTKPPALVNQVNKHMWGFFLFGKTMGLQSGQHERNGTE